MASPTVARSLFLVSSQERTGLFTIALGPSEEGGSTFRLELERGWIHGMANVARAASDEESVGRLLDRLGPDARVVFLPRPPNGPITGHRTSPFHPARLIRAHLEKTLGERLDLRLGDDEGDPRLRLVERPHPSCLANDEKVAVDLLRTPRYARELGSFLPAPRLRRLARFLEAAGALVLEDGALLDAYAALGVVSGAPAEEVKRAYYRLARELHPDRHPSSSLDEQRAFAAEFQKLSAAYRRIVADE